MGNDIRLELDNMKAIHRAHERWLTPPEPLTCLSCLVEPDENGRCECLLPKIRRVS